MWKTIYQIAVVAPVVAGSAILGAHQLNPAALSPWIDGAFTLLTSAVYAAAGVAVAFGYLVLLLYARRRALLDFDQVGQWSVTVDPGDWASFPEDSAVSGLAWTQCRFVNLSTSQPRELDVHISLPAPTGGGARALAFVSGDGALAACQPRFGTRLQTPLRMDPGETIEGHILFALSPGSPRLRARQLRGAVALLSEMRSGLTRRLRPNQIYDAARQRRRTRKGPQQSPMLEARPLEILPSESIGPLKADRDSRLTAHRRALAERAASHDWWDHPIPLTLAREGADKVEAREAICDWIEGRANRHCIILGDPGAGKTGLVWWAAAKLAEHIDAVTLMVPAARLLHLESVSLLELSRIAKPPLDFDLLDRDLGQVQLFLLLDGLDELVGSRLGGGRDAAQLLAKALAAIPPTARVLASCRTPSFSLLGGDLTRALPLGSEAGASEDVHDAAIAKALGLQNEDPLILRVEPVADRDAQIYLRSTPEPSRAILDDRLVSKIAPFLQTPFQLRLLSLAIPKLSRSGPIALDDLYKAYVIATLAREDPTLDAARLEGIIRLLRQIAHKSRTKASASDHELLVRTGLVTPTFEGYEFAHYSLWEFFFALELYDELIRIDSKTLAHVDLVNGYNANRMLVPMLVRAIAARCERSAPLHAVPSAVYQSFLIETGWRHETGYGIHPSVQASADGTPSSTFGYDEAETFAIHRDFRHGTTVTTALSWYDAAVFALHSGLRLPTSLEIRSIDCRGDFLFWCSDWHDEPVAHICVFDSRSGEIGGLNPDVRLRQTALAVVGKA